MDRKEIVARKQQYVYPPSPTTTRTAPLERGEMQHVWTWKGSAISISSAASSPSASATPIRASPAAEGPD